ncbi:MAG: adenine deaminase [Spirochaetaceae bacterium]|nr:adenine deaminase [Spirochaetaceae bacterium]
MNDEIRADIEVASGRIPADIALRNGRFLDVFTGELITGDLAIRGGRIVALGALGTYRGKVERDLERRIVVPGLIDAHVHIESSLHGPVGFAGLTVPRGTTTVVADPHEIANVRGMAGIRWMLDASENVPQTVFVMLPSCVPATPFEDAGAVLEASDLSELIGHPRVLGLGEAMDYPAVAAGRESIVDKIALARDRGKRVDGHSPAMTGKALAAYAAAGIGTDHECTTSEEMKERLRLGMRILIREGTAARDLAALIKHVNPGVSRRCAFCTDDKLPGDILAEGHIDHNIRSAISHGLDPVEAVRLATLNAAEAFGLDDRGALAPGRVADLAVLDGELADFSVVEVYRGGIPVARNGHLLNEPAGSDDSAVRDTVRLAPLGVHDLDLTIPTGRARVIAMSVGSLVTKNTVRKVPLNAKGGFLPNVDEDLLKLVVVERHKGSGRIGLGIVEGYGLKGGAAAGSIAHDSHNLIAIGDDDEAILSALRALATSGGGVSLAAAGGDLLGVLPLPLGGLMTDADGRDTAARMDELISIAHDKLGVREGLDPFMTLSFLALPVIPDLKLTARGLFDVKNFEFVSVEA